MKSKLLLFLLTAVLFFPTCSDDTSTDDGPIDAGGDTVAADTGSTDTADSPAPWSCEELDIAFGELVGSLLQTYAECPGCVASDCALVEPTLSCPNGAQVTLCQVAVADVLSSDFTTQLETEAAPLCERVDEPCISSASCAAASIVVTDDRCVLEIDY